MTDPIEEWARLKEIFDRAADLPPEDRGRVVAELADGDSLLAARVMDLLHALDTGGDRLERPPAETFDPFGTLPEGFRLGSYRLLREVGEGGMGSVFEALRDDDQFERRVAVKLVRLGMASNALIRRFRQERQILAGLEHPNIAGLLDGGVTEDGRPYLVMEFVDGEPITLYCEKRRLGIHERLRLFLSVCDAVQYSHRHLVVHRDLKPGNILVTPEGVVKLLDFGVAKLLPDPTLGDVRVTETAFRPLTPAYASPEQIKGEEVTTATDVYSLGVILYELLTGRHPFHMEGGSRIELAQALDTEPLRPSDALTEDPSVSRGLRFRRILAGELDNIILMAIRKEPERRYGSVEQLAEDVRRFLEGRPVLAQRDTLGYRTRKFVSRHRAGVAAASLVVVSLAAGMGTAAWQADRARWERDRARQEARKAEHISTFLTNMLRSPDPWTDGRDVRVMDLLDDAAARSTEELADEPETLAEIQTAIGMSYAGLGSYELAQPLLESALRIRRSLPGSDPNALSAALGSLAGLHLARGALGEAAPLLSEALLVIRPRTEADSILLADLRGQVGSMLQSQGDWEGAAQEHGEVLALRRALLGPDHADVAESLNDLAVVRGQRGDYAGAETLLREALAIEERAKGPEHPDVAAALSNLAFILTEQTRFEEADSFYRASLDIRRRRLGDEHPDFAWTLYGYATMLHERGDYVAAERTALQVLELRGRTLPDEHPMVSSSLQVVGRSLMARGRAREAEPFLRESLALRQASLPPDHWLLAYAKSVLGECVTDAGRPAEAEGLLQDGYAGLLAAMGPASPRTREAAERLARYYLLQGDTVRAAAYRGEGDPGR